jgi:ribosomal protein S18 acetylase RimI-like enzyme
MDKLLEILPWDSEFFNVPIGRATFSNLNEEIVVALMEEARNNDIRCIYFEANPNDPATVTTAEKHGFHLVDVRVVLEHPFHDRPAPVPIYPLSTELVIDLPHENDLDRLQDIGARIGLTSRFHFDKNFGPGYCDRLYRLWIRNSCDGFANIVLVARWSQIGEAAGFITCTLSDDVGHIQLAGVHFDHQKRGVGTGLVQAALKWAGEQGANRMQVVTQARNVQAQRLYQQMGFFTKSMTLYYHKWL